MPLINKLKHTSSFIWSENVPRVLKKWKLDAMIHAELQLLFSEKSVLTNIVSLRLFLETLYSKNLMSLSAWALPLQMAQGKLKVLGSQLSRSAALRQ